MLCYKKTRFRSGNVTWDQFYFMIKYPLSSVLHRRTDEGTPRLLRNGRSRYKIQKHPQLVRLRGFRLTQHSFNSCLLFLFNYRLHVSVVRPSSKGNIYIGN
jgi:hypothetical protein